MVARHVGGVHSRLLRGKGRAFARPAEAERARTLPGKNAAFQIADGDQSVVERSLDVHHCVRNVLALLFLELLLLRFFLRRGGRAAGGSGCCWFSHNLAVSS